MNVPTELIDSARIDGAGEFRILARIVLPLSKAVVAVVGLFYAVLYWNIWFAALLYLDDPSKTPIQLVMQQFLLVGQAPKFSGMATGQLPPTLALQMAVVVVAVVPIALVYPFVQRHFIKGVIIGAIKG